MFRSVVVSSICTRMYIGTNNNNRTVRYVPVEGVGPVQRVPVTILIPFRYSSGTLTCAPALKPRRENAVILDLIEKVLMVHDGIQGSRHSFDDGDGNSAHPHSGLSRRDAILHVHK